MFLCKWAIIYNRMLYCVLFLLSDQFFKEMEQEYNRSKWTGDAVKNGCGYGQSDDQEWSCRRADLAHVISCLVDNIFTFP